MSKPACTLINCCLFFSCFLHQSALANNPAYEQRQANYINTALANINEDAISIQAHEGIPLDSAMLQDLLSRIATGETSDFDIVRLVRVLFFSNGAYDAQLLPVLNSVPYWINNNDTTRNYWSENHMIMWMSSDWLLHEHFGKPVDSTLEARLLHYLELKTQYNFYEFFSSVYAPYTLSGLLNLADFAQHAQIKSLATQAAQRLLDNFLLLTNDKGVFFPVAGRNYPGKYESAYGQNHNNIIYLLTGFGQAPLAASHAGAFLATSTLPVDAVISAWTPQLDTLFSIGHSLDSGFVLNNQMTSADKVVFQWSSGAYFHPAVVQQTVQLLIDSNLWRHVDFELLRPLSFISPETAPVFAETFSALSKSTVICGQDIHVFKNNSVTLSSVIDFWKGKVGYQQHPCVANVGTTAVYTASGTVKANWTDRSENNANSHLPYVQQKKNVALIMYRPETIPALLANQFPDKTVALHWHDADFDEITEDSLWLLGRQEQNYVAVRRSCIGEKNGVQACETNGGQAWAIVVGDSAMYGSFSSFQNSIHHAQFTEAWYYDSLVSQSVYFASITVDTILIEYAWGVDSVATGGGNIVEPNPGFRVYPNPADDRVTVDLRKLKDDPVTIKAFNSMGQEVYCERLLAEDSLKIIPVTNWNAGVYLLIIESRQQRFIHKMSKID